MKRDGFSLIELLVVVAIIGIVATIGIALYSGYINAAKKAIVKNNWKTTVTYLGSEFAKCAADSSDRIFGNPGVKCSEIMLNNNWACAAITLTHTYNLSNPLDTVPQSWYGSIYSRMPNCVVVRNNSKGVGAGNGEQDGEVTIVLCPRNPYCSGNSGSFKVMWWWDNKTMQDFSIVNPNL